MIPNCTICFLDLAEDGKDARKTSVAACGHAYHTDCITGWFDHKGADTCPSCLGKAAPLGPLYLDGIEEDPRIAALHAKIAEKEAKISRMRVTEAKHKATIDDLNEKVYEQAGEIDDLNDTIKRLRSKEQATSNKPKVRNVGKEYTHPVGKGDAAAKGDDGGTRKRRRALGAEPATSLRSVRATTSSELSDPPTPKSATPLKIVRSARDVESSELSTPPTSSPGEDTNLFLFLGSRSRSRSTASGGQATGIRPTTQISRDSLRILEHNDTPPYGVGRNRAAAARTRVDLPIVISDDDDE